MGGGGKRGGRVEREGREGGGIGEKEKGKGRGGSRGRRKPFAVEDEARASNASQSLEPFTRSDGIPPQNLKQFDIFLKRKNRGKEKGERYLEDGVGLGRVGVELHLLL